MAAHEKSKAGCSKKASMCSPNVQNVVRPCQGDVNIARQDFFKRLQKFYESHGFYVPRSPMFNGNALDLFELYETVTSLGGSRLICNHREWPQVLLKMNLPCLNGGNLYYGLKLTYQRYLGLYEKVNFYNEEEGDTENDYEKTTREKVPSLFPTLLPQDRPRHRKCAQNMRVMYGLSTDYARHTDYDKLKHSFLSGQPNEVDFAINICTLLSSETKHILQLQSAPILVDLLLAQTGLRLGPSFDSLYSETWKEMKRDFLQFWKDSVLDSHILKLLYNYGLGDDADSAISIPDDVDCEIDDELFCKSSALHESEGQRIQQIALIMRNLSFEENNAAALASNTSVLRFLLLCACCRWSNLQQTGLDTLGNIASSITVRSDCATLLFGVISDCICSSDKFKKVRGLEVLAKLCNIEANHNALNINVAMGIYREMLAMIALNDVGLMIYTLECIYALSEIGEKPCSAIASIHRSIDVLIDLTTFDAKHFDIRALSKVECVTDSYSADMAQHSVYVENMSRFQPTQPLCPPMFPLVVATQHSQHHQPVQQSPNEQSQQHHQHHQQQVNVKELNSNRPSDASPNSSKCKQKISSTSPKLPPKSSQLSKEKQAKKIAIENHSQNLPATISIKENGNVTSKEKDTLRNILVAKHLVAKQNGHNSIPPDSKSASKKSMSLSDMLADTSTKPAVKTCDTKLLNGLLHKDNKRVENNVSKPICNGVRSCPSPILSKMLESKEPHPNLPKNLPMNGPVVLCSSTADSNSRSPALSPAMSPLSSTSSLSPAPKMDIEHSAAGLNVARSILKQKLMDGKLEQQNQAMAMEKWYNSQHSLSNATSTETAQPSMVQQSTPPPPTSASPPIGIIRPPPTPHIFAPQSPMSSLPSPTISPTPPSPVPRQIAPTRQKTKSKKSKQKRPSNEQSNNADSKKKLTAAEKQKQDQLKREQQLRQEQQKQQLLQQMWASLPLQCDWVDCGLCLPTPQKMFNHVCKMHVTMEPRQLCKWNSCDGLLRQRLSLVTHLQDKHCVEHELRNSAVRKWQMETQGTTNVVSQAAPPLHPGFSENAALQAICRYASMPSLQEFIDVKETPLTKAVRILSALSLRNIARHSVHARRLLKKHESMLTTIAFSAVDCSAAVSQLLGEIHHVTTTSSS